MTAGPTVRVVAAMLVESGRVLIARRGPNMALAGCWEFPGGKLEQGETPQAALEREILEELELVVRAERWLASSEFESGGRRIRLEGWLARPRHGRPRAREHDAWCWILPSRIDPATLAPGDRPLLSALVAHLAADPCCGGTSQGH